MRELNTPAELLAFCEENPDLIFVRDTDASGQIRTMDFGELSQSQKIDWVLRWIKRRDRGGVTKPSFKSKTSKEKRTS